MERFQIRNWSEFQHYKHRNPPWIRLYHKLLDNRDFHELSPGSAKVLMQLWLIASEGDGTVPALSDLVFRLRSSEKDVKAALTELYSRKFIENCDASNMLASCMQHALTEERRVDTDPSETEAETETEGSSAVSRTKAAEPTADEIFLSFDCIGKIKKWHLTKIMVKEFQELYPTIDIEIDARAAKAWTITNTKKTAKGMPAYLNRWFSRTANSRYAGKDTPKPKKKTEAELNGEFMARMTTKWGFWCPGLPEDEYPAERRRREQDNPNAFVGVGLKEITAGMPAMEGK